MTFTLNITYRVNGLFYFCFPKTPLVEKLGFCKLEFYRNKE